MDDIYKKLIDAYKALYNSIKEYYDYLKERIDACNLTHYNSSLVNFEMYMNDISMHVNLDSMEFIDVNIAHELRTHFPKKSDGKQILFYVQKGFDGSKIPVKNSEDQARYFTIRNSLPIMKLLPIQVASNALKYMPDMTPLTVLLTLTPTRNYLRFSNLGPKCEVYELELVFDEGYRGGNVDNTVGMGVGLSEVQLVMDMHYDWLETTCDVYSETSSFSMNSVEYSEFCLEVTYLPEEKTHSALPDMSEIREKSQVILLHNSFNLIENIIAVSNVFQTVNLKDDKWKEQYNEFRTYLSCFQDDVKYCQYLYNEKDVSRILGNRDVDIDIYYIVKKNIANVISTFFPEVRYDMNGYIAPVNTYSCMYSVIFGLLYQLISTMPADVTAEFSFMDRLIHIKCEDWCFEEALNGFDSEDADRFNMYRQMLGHMRHRISMRRDVVELIF